MVRIHWLIAAAAAALLVWSPAPALAQGVVGDVTRARSEAVGEATAVLGEWVRSEMVAVPADDGGKWQFLIFAGANCQACEKLKRDWKSNANLKALANEQGTAWGWLNVYEAENKSQAFRFKDYEVKQTPVIVVAPPANTKLWPYYCVFREEGYNGDADQLARRIVGAVKTFIAKHRPRPTPDQVPTPDAPRPDPAPPVPLPQPLVTPNVIPLLPNFPPLPGPLPNPTPGPGPAPGPGPNPIEPVYPDGLQVVFVLADPANILERVEVRFLKAKLDEFKRQYKLNFDVRLLKFADVGKRYPVIREELPALFVTEGRKLIVKASIGMLREILDAQSLDTPVDRRLPFADTPAEPPAEPRTPEDRVMAFLKALVAAIEWVPAALGWLGWLLVAGLGAFVIWRAKRPAKPAVTAKPGAAIVAEPVALAPGLKGDAREDTPADVKAKPAATKPAANEWSRPSDRAWAEVSAAQAAEQQAAQAREVAAAELAASEALLAKEAEAIQAAKGALAAPPPNAQKPPY